MSHLERADVPSISLGGLAPGHDYRLTAWLSDWMMVHAGNGQADLSPAGMDFVGLPPGSGRCNTDLQAQGPVRDQGLGWDLAKKNCLDTWSTEQLLKRCSLLGGLDLSHGQVYSSEPDPEAAQRSKVHFGFVVVVGLGLFIAWYFRKQRQHRRVRRM